MTQYNTLGLSLSTPLVSLVGSAHGHKGLAVTIGVVGGAIAVVDRVSLGHSHSRGDDSDSGLGHVVGDMAIGLGHETTGLAGHLLLDGVTHLPGHGVTPLHGHLDSDGEGDGGALDDGLVGADSLGDLPGDGGALGLGDLDTHGVGHIPADHGALLPGHGGALGHGDTVGDGNT